MTTPSPFTLEVLETHKMFYVLQHLPFDANDYTINAETPAGRQVIDFVDLFRTVDGRLIAAWVHPFSHLPIHQVWIGVDGQEENVNLTGLERVIDIYDRPLYPDSGVFMFLDSKMLAGPYGDWRCDTGKYTAAHFVETEQVFGSNNDLRVLEFVFSVNGVAHILYIQGSDHAALGETYCNNFRTPMATRTIQELIKLVDEWSQVAQPPFSNEEAIARKADQFMQAMRWTPSELAEIRAYPSMQIERYIEGDLNARRRPTDPLPMSATMRTSLFSRLAASSFSALSLLHQGLGDSQQLLGREQDALQNGLRRFCDYYEVPEHISFADTDAIVAAASASRPLEIPYAINQIRVFQNKIRILEGVANGEIL